MKKYFLIMLTSLSVGLLATSCSSDDDSTANDPDTFYLPLNTGNYWKYSVTTSQTSGEDSLYVANDTVIGSTTYKKLKTGDIPNGFFSGALSGNGVRQNGTKLQLSGSTGFAFSEDLPIALSVTDFTFFDAGASTGSQLGSTNGNIQQPTEDGYTLSLDYELVAVAGQNLDTYSVPGGATYSNVKAVQMNLTLTITALFDAGGFTIPAEILPEQQVLTSTQYYAEGIGAVYVSTDITYNLTDLSLYNIDLPIESSGTEHQDEVLIDYNVE